MRSVSLQRIVQYEFWPFWIFYIPAYFYWFYLSIKARSFFYFTSLNPCMNYGGTFLSSKQQYLKFIPTKWIPDSCVVKKDEKVSSILNKMSSSNLKFPIIAKPDFGERGKSVAKIDSIEEFEDYFQKTKYQTILLQQYIEYPIELGILFYWDTKGVGNISSIGVKSFCTIRGDGDHTFGQLVAKNPRISKRKKKKELQLRFHEIWNKVLDPTQEILVEPIGNHNRGTTFVNGMSKYSSHMLEWVKEAVSNIHDFDYGRLDLRIKNWEAFEKKEGIKVLEINGVNSEPIHIYDPKYGIRNAYTEIFRHMRIIHQLSLKKMQKHSPITFRVFFRGVIDFIKKKEPHNYLLRA